MAGYLLEVMLMRGKDWISRGFHEKGSGHPEDPLTVSGRQRALKMSMEFARRRCEYYRARQHRARIVDVNDCIILDWDTPLVPPQRFTRETLHRMWTYRSLLFLENRALGLFYHKFRWPDENGPERSVSGGTCEEVIERMFAMTDDVRAYLKAKLDQVETPEPPPAEPPPTVQMPDIALREGEQLVGVSFRPGCMPRG